MSLRLTWVLASVARRPRAVAGHALVLVAHRAHRDELAGIFEGAGQRILDDLELGMGVFLGKAPDLAAGHDRRIVVEIHLGDEVDLLAIEPAGMTRPDSV